MRPITIAGRVAAAVALVLLTVTLLPQAANAATPTRVSDHTESIDCEVYDGSLKVQAFVARSDLAGTQAGAKIARDGEVVAEGYAESDWSTPGTVRSSVDLLDEEGSVVHTVFLQGSYAAVGSGDRVHNRFKDGNINVVEDHTTWPLALSDIQLVLDGVTLSNVDCVGDAVDGYLSYTNPSSYVVRGGLLVGGECVTENARDFYFYGSVDELYVEFGYADSGDWSATSPGLNLLEAPYAGTFRLNDGTGPAGDVPATASLTRNGDVERLVSKDGVFSDRWVMTPYVLTVTADGPNAPVTATCAFYEVESTQHTKLNKLAE